MTGMKLHNQELEGFSIDVTFNFIN